MNSLVIVFLLLVPFCLSCVICFIFISSIDLQEGHVDETQAIHFFILCLTIWYMQLLNYYAALLQCVWLQTSPRHPHGWFWRIPLYWTAICCLIHLALVSMLPYKCAILYFGTNAENRTTLYIGLQFAPPYFYFNCEVPLFLWWFYFCFFCLLQILFGNNILMSLLICHLYCSCHD